MKSRVPRRGVAEVICGSGYLRNFWIDVRKILNSGKLRAGYTVSRSQNIGSKRVTRKILRNKELAAGSERRTSGVTASWNKSRPRMGTVWPFSQARVKCRCHRNSVFVCGKLLSEGIQGCDGGPKWKIPRPWQQERIGFKHHEACGSRFRGGAHESGPVPRPSRRSKDGPPSRSCSSTKPSITMLMDAKDGRASFAVTPITDP